MEMEQKKLKGYLQLNQCLTQALSKQGEGSPKKRNEMILAAKGALLDILRGLPNELNGQTLIDLQRELSRILAAEEIDVEEVVRFHQLVSDAMKNNSTRKTVVQVSLEISQALVDESQDVVRDKCVSALHLLSRGMIDCTGNEDMKPLFKLNEALSKAVAEEAEDKKLDLLTDSNLFLAEFMATGYPDTSSEWLVELNRLAALALVEKDGKRTCVWKAIKLLSQEMKKMADGVLSKDLLEMNFSLSCFLPEAGADNAIATFQDQLIEWKMQLANFMQGGGGESSKMKKTTAEGGQEAVLAENAKLKKEVAELIQARDESREELKKMNDVAVALTRDTMEQKLKIEELGEKLAQMRDQFRGPKLDAEATVKAGDKKEVGAEGPSGKLSVASEKKDGAEEATNSKEVDEEFLRRKEQFMKKRGGTGGVGEPGQVGVVMSQPPRRLMIFDADSVREDERLKLFEEWEKRKRVKIRKPEPIIESEVEPKPEPKVEQKPEPKIEQKSDPKIKPMPEPKVEPKIPHVIMVYHM